MASPSFFAITRVKGSGGSDTGIQAEPATARDTAHAAFPLELSASLRSSGVIVVLGVGAGRVGRSVAPKIHANFAGSFGVLIQPRPKHLLQRDGYSRLPRL
jgi:hypothetical protein